MRNITLVMKPTSNCTMRCRHCYHEEMGFAGTPMTLELLNKTLMVTAPFYNNVNFVWHGGEPLLMPIEFYKEAIAMQNYYKSNYGTVFNNQMQTNGELINSEIVVLLKEHKFSLGISYDGPYNSFLREKTEKVEEKILLLGEKGLEFAYLTVVSKGNVDKLIETYDFFKKKGRNLKLNPIFKSGNAKHNEEILLPFDDYMKNILLLFDYWLRDEQCNIIVNPFYELMSTVLTGKKRSCCYSSCLFSWVGVYNNGDLYPCGRAYTEDYKLGNIKDITEISSVFRTEAYKKLIYQSTKRRNKCMKTCKYFNYCEGGCNNDALVEGNIKKSGGLSCKAFKGLISYAIERVGALQRESKLNPYIKKLLFISNNGAVVNDRKGEKE